MKPQECDSDPRDCRIVRKYVGGTMLGSIAGNSDVFDGDGRYVAVNPNTRKFKMHCFTCGRHWEMVEPPATA